MTFVIYAISAVYRYRSVMFAICAISAIRGCGPTLKVVGLTSDSMWWG